MSEITGDRTPRRRLLIVVTHFVQYASPQFRRMAADPRFDLLVAYCSSQGAEAAMDPEFGVKVAWDTPVTEGFPHVIVPNRSTRPGLGRFWGCFNPGLWRLLRDGKFDAVYVTGYAVASFWIAMLAAKRFHVPLIQSTDAHALGSRRVRSRFAQRLKRWIVGRIFGLADVTLGMSSGSLEYLQSLGIDESHIRRAAFVVENEWWLERAATVDRSAVRAEWNVPTNAPVALFCAKLQTWKRPSDALLAFARADAPDSYLIFAGDGPLRPELEARAKALGVAGRVRFLGFVNQSALPGVYAASDVLLLPSGYEPFGLVVNEAMLCGIPAIVSDSVGAKFDLIREGETGFVFPTRDVDALASILVALLADTNRLRQMGAAARRRMETWSPREYVEDLVVAVETARRNASASSTIHRAGRRTVEKVL